MKKPSLLKQVKIKRIAETIRSAIKIDISHISNNDIYEIVETTRKIDKHSTKAPQLVSNENISPTRNRCNSTIYC